MKPSSQDFPFQDISDTARFVALLRAMEGERPDAHFKDPFALRFVGEREPIMRRFLKKSTRFDARTMAVRTQVLDERFRELIGRRGVDTVLNLAAGLDTRPYRLDLPASLRWIEVDLPGLLGEKEKVLADQKPRCGLERVALDLTDRSARRAFFSAVGGRARKALVLTEGLLMYLKAEEVDSLARDLAAHPVFRYWLMDLLSPSELEWLRRKYGDNFTRANAQVHFGPEEGPEYFRSRGWKPLRYYSFVDEAHRLRRESRRNRLLRWVTPLAPRAWRERRRMSYGILSLERN